MHLTFWLKSSRPGLWFATIWLYLLPTSTMYELGYSWKFWFGFFFICLPLNLLNYAWNDYVDWEADKLNPRKDSFLFGGLGSKEERDSLPFIIKTLVLLFFPLLIFLEGWEMAVLLFVLLIINYLYNQPKWGLRNRPPFELLCQIGYLLVVPFSILMNDAYTISGWAILYLICFAFQSHLIGEVMDIEPDRKGGKVTTATEIGMFKTKLLIIFLVMTEIAIIYFIFNEVYFALMFCAALCWLLIDLFLVFKQKKYTLFQMKLFGYGSNLIGLSSIAYVWWSGFLVQ